MDRNITVRHIVYALALYVGYILLKDHLVLAAIQDLMGHIQVV